VKVSKKINVCEPFLNGNELEYVTAAVKDNWISSLSPAVTKLENNFSQWLFGTQGSFSTTTTSGTTALSIALHTLKIGGNYGGNYRDEVIIPDFTMIAVPNTIHWAGASPVLCDVSYGDFNIHAKEIKSLITKHTKAIVVTHTYGIPNDMTEIMKLAKEYDLKVIEDCAEGLGGTHNGQKLGTFGDMSIFSFYANKIITTGEGGMVCSKDEALIKRAYFLKNHTFSKEKHFWHKEIGHNFRMTGLQASLGLAQLEKIDEYVTSRRSNATIYNNELQPHFDKFNDKNQRSFYELMPTIDGAVYWMYGVRVPFKWAVRDKLKKAGIETRSYFIPIHRQKPYIQDDDDFWSSKMLHDMGFYLPSGSGLTVDEIKYICAELIKAIKEVDK